jgi:hypothetical protein
MIVQKLPGAYPTIVLTKKSYVNNLQLYFLKPSTGQRRLMRRRYLRNANVETDAPWWTTVDDRSAAKTRSLWHAIKTFESSKSFLSIKTKEVFIRFKRSTSSDLSLRSPFTDRDRNRSTIARTCFRLITATSVRRSILHRITSHPSTQLRSDRYWGGRSTEEFRSLSSLFVLNWN